MQSVKCRLTYRAYGEKGFTMKKIIALFLAVITAAAVLCAAHKPIITYAHTALITALDYDTDTVTVTDYSGLTWTFSGCEDYCVDDLVSLTMSDNGTKETVMDDEILSATYAGYLPYWYLYGGDGYAAFHGIGRVEK